MRARLLVSVGSCLGLLLGACLEPRLGKVVPVLSPTSPPPPPVQRVGTFDLVVRTDVAIDDTLPPEPGSDACVALRVTDGSGAALAAPSELCGALHPGPRGNGDLALSLPCNPDAPAHQIQLWLRTLAYPAGHPILPAEIDQPCDPATTECIALQSLFENPCDGPDGCVQSFTCDAATPAAVAFDLAIHGTLDSYAGILVRHLAPPEVDELCYDFRITRLGAEPELVLAEGDPREEHHFPRPWATGLEGPTCVHPSPDGLTELMGMCRFFPRTNAVTVWTHERTTDSDGTQTWTRGPCPGPSPAATDDPRSWDGGCSLTFDCTREGDTVSLDLTPNLAPAIGR